MSLPFNLKSGVDPTGITAELAAALGIAQNVYSSLGQPFTITSLSEGQHVIGSKHYIGQAADLRTNGVDPATVPAIAQQLRAELGPGYTVLQESDHIHMQYNGAGTPPAADPSSGSAGAIDAAVDWNSLFSATPEEAPPVSSDASVSGGLVAAIAIGGLAAWLIFR